MSMYNMVMGHNPACVILMPMLGRKESEYPRFRDCFLSEDGERIAIYTRVGGNNRNSGFGEEKLYSDPNFANTYDDDFDNTYATYEFNVPEKWKKDFECIKNGTFSDVSQEYVNYVKSFFPKLAEAGLIDKTFERKGSDDGGSEGKQ